MTATRRTIGRGQVGPDRFLLDFVKGRYCFENFMQSPLSMVKAGGTEGLVPTGTSLNEHIVNTGRHVFEYYYAGDVTDAFVPTLASEGGYNWLFSDVLATGFELNFGGLVAGHPRNLAPLVSGGGGEDWFSRILLITDDASGADVLFGFRKVAAPALTLTEYADVFGVRILGDSSSTAGAFSIITSPTDYTSTALAGVTGLEDATAIELEVRAIGGKGFLYVNGVEVSGFGGKQFVAGHTFSPVLRGLQATDVWAQLKTLCYEAGPLDCRQEGTLLSLAGATS